MTHDSHLPDEDKIRITVETCLAFAADSERPFQQAADLLAMLKNTPGWTDAEIYEVQGRIMDALHQIGRERQRSQTSRKAKKKSRG